jgi:hypothetical protein
MSGLVIDLFRSALLVTIISLSELSNLPKSARSRLATGRLRILQQLRTMMPFTRSGYDPDTLALLYRVFKELLSDLAFARDPWADEGSSEARSLRLANALMDGVAAGHRDPESLKRHALAKLAANG